MTMRQAVAGLLVGGAIDYLGDCYEMRFGPPKSSVEHERRFDDFAVANL